MMLLAVVLSLAPSFRLRPGPANKGGIEVPPSIFQRSHEVIE
jgi:hypothetical protein